MPTSPILRCMNARSSWNISPTEIKQTRLCLIRQKIISKGCMLSDNSMHPFIPQNTLSFYHQTKYFPLNIIYIENIIYICCNLKYLIWLSTLCRKLAWERATDKKIPSCLESLYSSCFQITLFSWCKGSIFSWLPVIFGHKISRSFQETYTADMTAIP